MTPSPELAAKLEELSDALREVGIYVDSSRWVEPQSGMPLEMIEGDPPGVLGLLTECLVGDLAFSARVQHPVQHDMDAEFRRMAADLTAERISEMRRRLTEGQNLFEEGDD